MRARVSEQLAVVLIYFQAARGEGRGAGRGAGRATPETLEAKPPDTWLVGANDATRAGNWTVL